MNNKKRIVTFLLSIALIFAIGGELLLSSFCLKSSAETSTYTDVLSDLSKDNTFDANKYRPILGLKSLHLISIAEGVHGELYLYVYQPSNETADYKATYINMATEELTDKNINYKLYSLTWINSNGVFVKYLVNDFTVKDDTVRYYNIASIYRPCEEGEGTFNAVAVDNKQHKSYSVAQAWCAYLLNNTLIYEMEKMCVVEYTVYASGSVRYNDGFYIGLGYKSACDSHYVAFSIDNFDVEKIYDADISYTVNLYEYEKSLIPFEETTTLISSEDKTKKLSIEDEPVSNNATGLFAKNYFWSRIQDVSSFMEDVQDDANESFNDEEISGLEKSEFVFRFEETDWSYMDYNNGNIVSKQYAEITNFGILRIRFLSEGKPYNLGVVGDLVGTDSNPELNVGIDDNIINTFEDLMEGDWWQKIMMILGIIILLLIILIFSAPIKSLFKIISNGIKFMLQCIVKLISAPFDFIVALLRK